MQVRNSIVAVTLAYMVALLTVNYVKNRPEPLCLRTKGWCGTEMGGAHVIPGR